MHRDVLSITQLNEYIRRIMDSDSLLSGVAVRGEISNYKVYPSGHHYFTLKDNESSLKCVMFRSSAQRLRFMPENGMKIIAMGKISVYPRDGAYQLYCSTLTVDGVGDLHAAFEQLKVKLQRNGLFDPDHKKTLPFLPGRICIITSEAGAAIHDMLRIINKRCPITKVVLLPVRVQGAEAPAEIAAAIRYANMNKLADVLIVGRGGGSIEDLWAFNDEGVAQAIFDSEIPVISAVGHEPDITISDYVADVRAATPSNAAELAVPDQNALRQTFDAHTMRISSVIKRLLRLNRERLGVLSSSPALKSPTGYIENRRKSLHLLCEKLTTDKEKILNSKKQQYISLAAKLDAMSPLKVLSRGYALPQLTDGNVLRSVEQIHQDEILTLTIADGSITAKVIQKEARS